MTETRIVLQKDASVYCVHLATRGKRASMCLRELNWAEWPQWDMESEVADALAQHMGLQVLHEVGALATAVALLRRGAIPRQWEVGGAMVDAGAWTPISLARLECHGPSGISAWLEGSASALSLLELPCSGTASGLAMLRLTAHLVEDLLSQGGSRA